MAVEEIFNVELNEEEERPPLAERLANAFVTRSPTADHKIMSSLPFFEEAFELTIKDHMESQETFWEKLVHLSDKKSEPYIKSRKYEPGETIIRFGEHASTVFWILEGRVDIFNEVDGKRRKVESYSERGVCVGELTILLGGGRNADVVASDEGAHMLEITISITSILELPELNNFFYVLISKNLAEKLGRSYQKPIETARKAVKELHKVKRDAVKLRKTNEKLRGLLEKHNIDTNDL